MNAVTPTNTFELVKQDTITSLNIELQTYKHIKTGALHYHFACDHSENVFLAGFRTVPTDSTGVAHILEHTALCGSERFPVRDPFFMMLRRSLNTFMNAITSSDWTAYPFASANRKDFFNLLDVYLDAVFFSNLDELDFAQEGHRVAFENDDPNAPLEYRGVVFNEMKGAMSSVQAVLWQTITKHVFTHTTYHHNSGGEPADIPSLSYDDLVRFYKKHYHPSNAMLMTFGDIPASTLQKIFEDKALSKFDVNETSISVALEPRLDSPKTVEEPYAAASEDDKSHVTVAWMLGESTDIEGYLRANILEGILLDNSASPLRNRLETSKLGSSPSSMCGLEDTNRQMMFIAGLEGCEQADASDIEAEILQCLEHIKTHGVPQSDIDAVLHQLELHQREIGGDGYPYGLQLIMQSLSSAVHRGNPIDVLDIDTALEKIRVDSQAPGFVASLIDDLLLNNTHRVRVCLYPDTTLGEKQRQQEIDKLAALKDSLDEESTQAIVDLNQRLAARQAQQDDPGLLPKVGLNDIPSDIPHYTANTLVSQYGLPQYRYAAATNGLVYQQLVISLAGLSTEQRVLLPFYSRCLTEVGIAEEDYLHVQQRQAATVGHISSYFGLYADRNQPSHQLAYFTLDSKALARNYSSQSALMLDTLKAANFNTPKRIKELLQQYVSQKVQSVVGNGHSYAMQIASTPFSAINQLESVSSGLEGIVRLKALLESLDDSLALTALIDDLNALHQHIMSAPRLLLEVADEDILSSQKEAVAWDNGEGDFTQNFCLDLTLPNAGCAWQINSQVSFCALTFRTVEPTHPDAGPLAVLGGFIRNGYLHTAIREKGGAYGGGASHDAGNSVFRFYSYRDPRLEETFADFNASIEWMLTHHHDERHLEEAILGVIGSMDKPGSPAGECKNSFYHELYGRSLEQRLRFREQVINTRLEDLKRVTQTYLTGPAHYAVLAGESQLNAASDFLATHQLARKVL